MSGSAAHYGPELLSFYFQYIEGRVLMRQAFQNFLRELGFYTGKGVAVEARSAEMK
jgi:hypothetical protein